MSVGGTGQPAWVWDSCSCDRTYHDECPTHGVYGSGLGPSGKRKPPPASTGQPADTRIEAIRQAMICDDHTSDDCPCLQWAPEAFAALDAVAAELADLRQALEQIAEPPLCDDTFRARLLRQGLSNEEMRQYVESAEALQAAARAALAGSVAAPPAEPTT